jgi:predicted nucleic acid-binding protein
LQRNAFGEWDAHFGSAACVEGIHLGTGWTESIRDACVRVKWCVPEPDSASAVRLLDPRFELHIPSCFFTESASVLQRKVAVDRTSSEAESLAAFQLLQMIPMTVHPTEGLLEHAFRNGVRYRRPVYDSVYLVLAASNGVHGVPLDHLVLWVTDSL